MVWWPEEDKALLLLELKKETAKATDADAAHLNRVADKLEKVARGATANEIKAKILIPWLTTVIASPDSLSLQATACRTFGHQPPPFMKDEFDAATIHWDLIYAIGEMYNLTQEELTKSGDFTENDTIPIYHPYVPQESTPKGWQKGDEVRAHGTCPCASIRFQEHQGSGLLGQLRRADQKRIR